MRRILLAAALVVTGCASESQPKNEVTSLAEALGAELPRMPVGRELEGMVQAASRHPLGSAENPIRVGSISEQRDYLSRLRCANGLPPRWRRIGPGPMTFGRISDAYAVECAGGAPTVSTLYLDAYHQGHRERAAPSGFTLR